MIKTLGGKSGDLKCCKCGNPRYQGVELCPDCWGEENDGGTRNSRGVVIQALLPRDVWQAVNFAASMMRKGTERVRAIRTSAKYYSVSYEDVQSGLSQRAGRCRKGKTF